MSKIPDWNDLTELEQEKIKNGELIDIDGINYKVDTSKLDCKVFLTKKDGTIVPIQGR